MKTTRRSLAIVAAVAGLIAVAGRAYADPPQAAPQQPVDPAGTETAGNDGFGKFLVHIEFLSRANATATNVDRASRPPTR